MVRITSQVAADTGHSRGTLLRRHLRVILRIGITFVLLAGVGLAWRWNGAARRPGRPEANLVDLLRARYGLWVATSDVQIPDGLPKTASSSFGYRNVFFLGRKTARGPRDVYWVMVRFSVAGIPLAARALVNLSRTPAIDESVFLSAGPFVAFVIPAGRQVGAIVVVDGRGDHPNVLRRRTRLRRITNNVTNFQETGHWRGFSRHALEPEHPLSAVTLRWERPGLLRIRAHGDRETLTAALHCDRGALSQERPWLMYQPPMKGEKPLFNWLVDTVRRLPGVGAKKIEWMEVALYTLVDLFRRRVRKPGGAVIAPDEQNDGKAAVAMDHDLYKPKVGAVVASNWPPPPLVPLLAGQSVNEGKWFAPPKSQLRSNPGAPVPVLETFVHPDPKRPYAAVGVLIWDPRQVRLGFVAGTREPESTTGLRGWGRIPRDDRLDRVIAAFNGGFQTMHGEWGMQARGRLIREPAKWAATVATDRSGRMLFGTWERSDKKVPPELVSFRQNLTPLFEDGVVNPLRNRYWGLAVRKSRERIHIVRSGMCLTKEGHGAYLWGKAVSLTTLARAMKIARCQYGMQMDINQTNASLELFRIVRRSSVKGSPPRRFERGGRSSWGIVPGANDWVFYARSWLPGMYTVPFPRYIRRDWRDFFYLSLRGILPGANVPPVIQPARTGEGVWSVSGLPQGKEPFPPRIAITSLRPDVSRPQLTVQLVKLDPRRLAFRRVHADTTGQGPVDFPRPVACLMFGKYPPPGLEIDGQATVAVTGSHRALLVESGPEEDGAPRARMGKPGSTPRGEQKRLVIAGGELGAVAAPAAATTTGNRAAAEARELRASALAVDGVGHICYAVAEAVPDAGTLLRKALVRAGCQGGIRLPDRPGRGPLVLGPDQGRIRLLPGDSSASPSATNVVGISWADFLYSKRLMVGVAHRPANVQFGISPKERSRIRRKLKLLRSGMATTP
ncbi:MAG: hypothetical protein ABI333_10480 [bacterium]